MDISECQLQLDQEIKQLKSGVRYCKGEFDGIICWNYTKVGESAIYPCSIGEGTTERFCELDGNWKVENNIVWAKYNCDISHVSVLTNYTKQNKFTEMSSVIYCGHSFSIVALLFAMMIFTYFKRLHCTRNYIHINLFASFFLRAILHFVKEYAVKKESGIDRISEIQNSTNPDITNANVSIEDLVTSHQATDTMSHVTCKVVVSMYRYLVASNYFWVLAEALYLHCLIFVTFFAEKKYLWIFVFTGWISPIFFTVPWIVLKELVNPDSCWDSDKGIHRWIFDVPVILATTINFVLFINILRVLWYKMRYSICRQPGIGIQYKKLARSTLVLIPLFGVHVILFRAHPDNSDETIFWKIRIYWELFFDSFQGFFVAVIYCFINAEVLSELKRTWNLFKATSQIERNQRHPRSTNTTVANFSSTGAQSARPSLSYHNKETRACKEMIPMQSSINKASNQEMRRNNSSDKISNEETKPTNNNQHQPESQPLLNIHQRNKKSQEIVDGTDLSKEAVESNAEVAETTLKNDKVVRRPAGKINSIDVKSPTSTTGFHLGRKSSDDSGINSLVTLTNRQSSNYEDMSCCESISGLQNNSIEANG